MEDLDQLPRFVEGRTAEIAAPTPVGALTPAMDASATRTTLSPHANLPRRARYRI